ncbi:DUF4906 domain-containing protein [Bacteroides sp.]
MDNIRYGYLRALCLNTIILLALGSCNKDSLSTPNGEEGQAAVIRVEAKASNVSDVQSRAVNENDVNDLHVLVYDKTGNLTGQNYAASNSIEVNTRSGEHCTVYVIANTGNEHLFDGEVVSTLQKLKELTTASLSAWDALGAATHMVMVGSKPNVTISPEANRLGTISVSRIAAKITLDVNVEAGSDIVIKSYQICSLPAMSYYLPNPMTTESAENDTDGGKDAPQVSKDADWKDSPKIAVTDATSLNATFYMYENRKGVVSSITEQKDKSKDNAPDRATYLLITGAGTDCSITWRIYLGANNSSNFNIKRNGAYTYNITLRRNDADSRVTVNTMKTVVGGKVNSFMVPPVSAVTVPVECANMSPIALDGSTYNSATKTYTQIKDDTPWTAVVVWQSSKNLITLSDDSGTGPTGRFTVTAPGTDFGNAVVAVKSGSNILWSWHIWVTDYDGTATITTNNGAYDYVFMDRALGATSNVIDDVHSAGLYYQWGRKDPFPGTADDWSGGRTVYNANGSTVPIFGQRVTVANNFTNAIRNPTLFYKGDNSLGDWITNTSDDYNNPYQIDDLWGGKDRQTLSKKSVFDPCPEGWRVPAYRGGKSPFEKMGVFRKKTYGGVSINDESNYWAGSGIMWFNGMGIIYEDLGTPHGLYWVATSTQSWGMGVVADLDFTMPEVSFYMSESSGPRDNGFFVRCVKE